MAIIINTNAAALTAQKNLASSQSSLATSIARLSSGLRITKAADDAAGLAISEKMDANIRGFQQAARNASSGISLLQTAEGGMASMASSLKRMQELATQSASGDYTNADRTNMDKEFTALKAEINRISTSTSFNGVALLDGSTASISLQVGIGASDQLSVAFSGLNTTSMSLNGASDAIDTAANASAVLSKITAALDTVSTARAGAGALQNRLDQVISGLTTTVENTSAALSRIRDVDVATETAAYTKNQILVQAGVSVLAQANQQPSIALSLLK